MSWAAVLATSGSSVGDVVEPRPFAAQHAPKPLAPSFQVPTTPPSSEPFGYPALGGGGAGGEEAALTPRVPPMEGIVQKRARNMMKSWHTRRLNVSMRPAEEGGGGKQSQRGGQDGEGAACGGTISWSTNKNKMVFSKSRTVALGDIVAVRGAKEGKMDHALVVEVTGGQDPIVCSCVDATTRDRCVRTRWVGVGVLWVWCGRGACDLPL